MRKLTLILILFSSCALFAQRQDFTTWWAAGVEGELKNKIEWSVTPQVRLYQNSTALKSVMVDLDASYPIAKFLSLGGEYRAQRKYYNEGEVYNGHRMGVYAGFSTKVHKFRLKYRALYQWAYLGVGRYENSEIPSQEHRHKFSVSYYKKNWGIRPVISNEFYFQTKPDYELREQKWRLTAGGSYKFNKQLSLGLYYRYQKELLANNPWEIHIISSKISYKF